MGISYEPDIVSIYRLNLTVSDTISLFNITDNVTEFTYSANQRLLIVVIKNLAETIEQVSGNPQGYANLIREIIKKKANIIMDIWQYFILDKTKEYELRLNANQYSIPNNDWCNLFVVFKEIEIISLL